MNATFEMLKALADGQGEIYDQARTMIGGTGALVLLMVKAALANTTETPSAAGVAQCLAMSESGARKKMENIAVRESVGGSRI
jgi:hypothetical protein